MMASDPEVLDVVLSSKPDTIRVLKALVFQEFRVFFWVKGIRTFVVLSLLD